MTIEQIARNLRAGDTTVAHEDWLAALDAVEKLTDEQQAQLDDMIVPGESGELPNLVTNIDRYLQ